MALGLLLVVGQVWWTLVMEEIYFPHWPTSVSIFFHCVSALVALIGLNALLRRQRPAWALSRPELLLVYAMMSIGAAVAGHDQQMVYLRGWIYPLYRALWDPTWQAFTTLPWNRALTVTDPEALQKIFQGHATLYVATYLRAWAIPALFLIAFLAFIQVSGLAISAIFLRQWADSERLTFPLAQLPLDLTAPGFRLWRRPAFWVALIAVFAVDVLNGLHELIPTVPSIPIKGLAQLPFLSAPRPWSGAGFMFVRTYPFMIGLAFLLPTDLSLSCVVFFLLAQLQLVAAVAMGYEIGFPWDAQAQAPFLVDQGVGAMWALFVALVLRARRHLRAVWDAARGRSDEDPAVCRLYRRALLALAGSALGMVLLLRLVGASWPAAVVAIAAYLVLITVVCKVRAELGPPMYDLHFSGPDRLLTMFAGPANLGKGDWLGIGFLFGFNRGMRNLSLPHETEGLWAVRQAGGRWDRAAAALAGAGVLAAAATCWGMLHLGYEHGFENMAQASLTGQGWMRMRPWLDEAPGPHWAAIAATGSGAAVAAALIWARQAFFGFPLHAVGYALATNWAMSVIWFPMLIAWVAKVSILRYRGRAGYQAALPFFLGLVLADFLAGSFWSLYGMAAGVTTYSVTW